MISEIIRIIADEKERKEILSRKNSAEIDEGLSELLSDTTKDTARRIFSRELSLDNVGDEANHIIEYLVEYIMVQDGMILPRKIVLPSPEDKVYLEAYKEYQLTDAWIEAYSEFKQKILSYEAESAQKISSLKDKISKAEAREGTLRSKIKDAEQTLAQNGNIAERTKAEKCKDDAENELDKLETDIGSYNDKIEKVEKSTQKEVIGICTRGFSFDVDEDITDKINGIEPRWIDQAFEEPEESVYSKIGGHKLAAVSAVFLSIGILIGYHLAGGKETEVEHKKSLPSNFTAGNRAAAPETVARSSKSIKVIPRPENNAKQRTFNLICDEKRYLPGEVEVLSFDPETKQVVYNYNVKNGESRKVGHHLELTDEQLNRDSILLVAHNYVRSGFNLFEKKEFYLVDKEGRFTKADIKSEGRLVQKNLIEQALLRVVRGYQSKYIGASKYIPRAASGISIEYIQHQNSFLIRSNHAKRTVRPTPPVKPGLSYDKWPDLVIEAGIPAKKYVLDVCHVREVKRITPLGVNRDIEELITMTELATGKKVPREKIHTLY